jgi:hypothetical protein
VQQSSSLQLHAHYCPQHRSGCVGYLHVSKQRCMTESLSTFLLQIAELLARAGLWQPYQDFMKDIQAGRPPAWQG